MASAQKERILTFYKHNPWLNYIPFLGKLLQDIKNSEYDSAAQKRVSGIYSKIIFYKSFYRHSPRKYIGGVVVNILGWQVVRTLCHHLTWKMRRVFFTRSGIDKTQTVKILDQDGVVVLSDIFTHDEVNELVKDFDEKSHMFVSNFEEFREGLIIETNATKLWSHSIGSSIAERLIQKNKKLQTIIEEASGIQANLLPEITYLEYKAKKENLGKAQEDGQDRIHSDVVYPSFKIFIYLHETNESNGAFKYCPGSHKLTFKRLYFEYILSIRYFISLRKSEYKPTHISDNEKAFLSLNEKSMNGKAGSVVIFNTMGFHRRGDFSNGEKLSRHVMLSNYRYLNSWANVLGLKVKN